MAAIGLDRKTFERQYFQEGRSLQEIADSAGTSVYRVRVAMADWGIRPTKKRPKSAEGRPPLTYDLLKKLRVDQRKSLTEIGDELGYSRKRVSAAVRRYGLAFDYHSPLADRLGPGELWFLHQEQGCSTEEIASRFGSSPTAVRRRMVDVGVAIIPRRTTRTPKPVRPKNIPSPNVALLAQLDAEVASRPRQSKTKAIDAITAKEFRRLHYDEKLSIKEIAARYHTAARFVSQRARDLGIELRLRSGGARGIVLSQSQLEQRNALCATPDVRRVLRRHRVQGKVEAPKPVVDLTGPMLRELYEDCQLGIDEIVLLCVRSRVTVAAALRRHGIEIRPPYLPRPVKVTKVRLTRKRFEAQLAKGKSLKDIAKQFGYASETSLRIVATALQVALPDDIPPKIPRAVHREIRDTGVDDEHAAIVLSPKHGGKGAYKNVRPWPGAPRPALLRYLFVDLGLSKHEIAARLHAAWDVTWQAFLDADIPPERHSRPKPFGRWRLDVDELRRLSSKEMSGRQISEHLGVSTSLVLHAMHRLHLPVRINGNGVEIRVRFDELVSDRRVVEALRGARVPLAEVDPPNRGPLPADLLDRLVNDFKLSFFDIELLTGRIESAARRDAKQAGILR